jgi:hypothetical protein
MGTRYFALIFGIIYLLIGILGLIPGLLTPLTTTGVTLNVLSGNLFGLFPVNILHTLIHLIVGIWGIVAYRTFSASRSYARTIGVIFIVLFIFGLIPGLNVLFGLTPLNGADIWLHLLTGVIALYFGLTARTPAEAADMNSPTPPMV